MAGPAENSLSLGQWTQNKENTFTKQHGVKRSRAMHLQLYLQELKDRERQAQEHNSQLLQQFEKAQDALKEMLAHIAAMKTIRMEYERYLEDNSSRWQLQLQEQTQAVQMKRMVDSLGAVMASTVDMPLLSQGPSNHKSFAPQVCSTQEKSDYNQNNPSHHPYTQSSCLTPSFLRASHQSHNPFLFPSHTFLHPLSQPFTSTPGHHQTWSRQDDTGGDSGPCAAGISSGSLGQLHTEKPPASGVPQTGEEHDGGSTSCVSPDLDIKPVRLFSSHAESSESDSDSSLTSREKTKKEKRRKQHSPSQKPMATASFLLPQSSESNPSSEECSTKEQTKRDEEESQHSHEEEGSSKEKSPSEKVEDQSHADESDSSGAEQEPGRRKIKTETRSEEETDDQEQSSIKGKGGNRQKNPGSGDQEETENSQSEEQGSDEEEDDYDDDVSITGKTEQEAEVRMEDQGEDEQQKQSSASSQDGSESSEDQGEDTGEESEDTEDVIIAPQNKRSKQIQIISEVAEDEENKTQSSKEISDEDIENLLAPQEQTEEKDLKADEEPKAIYHKMDIFQVVKEKSKTDDKRDSDEFDHFYD